MSLKHMALKSVCVHIQYSTAVLYRHGGGGGGLCLRVQNLVIHLSCTRKSNVPLISLDWSTFCSISIIYLPFFLPFVLCSLFLSFFLSTSQDCATMQFCANKLDKKDFFGRSDPFMVFYRSNEDGTWVSCLSHSDEQAGKCVFFLWCPRKMNVF